MYDVYSRGDSCVQTEAGRRRERATLCQVCVQARCNFSHDGPLGRARRKDDGGLAPFFFYVCRVRTKRRPKVLRLCPFFTLSRGGQPAAASLLVRTMCVGFKKLARDLTHSYSKYVYCYFRYFKSLSCLVTKYTN